MAVLTMTLGASEMEPVIGTHAQYWTRNEPSFSGDAEPEGPRLRVTGMRFRIWKTGQMSSICHISRCFELGEPEYKPRGQQNPVSYAGRTKFDRPQEMSADT